MRFGQSEICRVKLEKINIWNTRRLELCFACYGHGIAGSNPAHNPIRVCGAIESPWYVVAPQTQCQHQNGSHGLDENETDRGPLISSLQGTDDPGGGD